MIYKSVLVFRFWYVVSSVSLANTEDCCSALNFSYCFYFVKSEDSAVVTVLLLYRHTSPILVIK